MQTEPTQYELATKNNALTYKSYNSLNNKVDKIEKSLSIERLTLRSESNRSLSPRRQETAQQQMESLIGKKSQQVQSTEFYQINQIKEAQDQQNCLPSINQLFKDEQEINQNQSQQLGEPVIQCENIFKTYKLQKQGISALKDISLSPNCEFLPIRRGEFVIIRGPSGGGKTTLLNMFGMIDKPSNEIDEISSDNHLSQLRMLHIGFVFQSFNLMATMTALENVELPMILANQMSEYKIKERAKELLTKVNLKDRMNHLPSELSGGEKQRTAIARALSNCPQILLLDEPTGDLDTENTVEIMDLLLEINKTTTIVMVTHNPDLECYANRILYVEDGQITCQAINTTQNRLNLEKYLSYLNKKFNYQLHQFILTQANYQKILLLNTFSNLFPYQAVVIILFLFYLRQYLIDYCIVNIGIYIKIISKTKQRYKFFTKSLLELQVHILLSLKHFNIFHHQI